MARSNNGKIYAVIAAIFYAIYVVWNIYWYINGVGYYFKGELILETILIIIFIVMAITLVIGDKKGIVGTLGALFLIYIAYLIYENIIYGLTLDNWIDIGVYAALFVIGILMIYGNTVVKMIWFVPGIASIVSYCIFWYLDLFSYTLLNFEAIIMYWTNLLPDLCGHAAVIFIGLWMMKNVGSATAMRVNEYIPNNMWAPYPSPTQGGAFGGAYKQKVYCRNCGAEMQDNEIFCFNCGTAKEPNIADNVNANHQNL